MLLSNINSDQMLLSNINSDQMLLSNINSDQMERQIRGTNVTIKHK
jgi:hypothetical protein